MRITIVWFVIAIALFGGFITIQAADMRDKVKVEIESVGLHPGMDPGMYVCALGHLHIKGTVQNLANVDLGQIKVAGKAFDATGKLLGTAAASTKEESLAPSRKADVNVEFLTVIGPMIQQVKRHEVTVTAAPSRL